MFLNRNLHVCTEEQAIYLSRCLNDFKDPRIEETQELESYSSKLTQAAERISQSKTPNPIGAGKTPTQKLSLAGLQFSWEGTHWELDRINHQIRISPATDRNDATVVLETLKSIRTGVFNRSFLATEETIFIIGATDKESENCVASAQRKKIGRQTYNLIRIPFCENGAHLIPVQLDDHLSQSFPTSGKHGDLQKIILHEIGHTLRVKFQEQRENLRRFTEIEFGAIAPVLKEISPVYLGTQADDITESILLKRARTLFLDDTPTEIKLEANRDLTRYSQKIGAEVFAEMLRHYYLEPCVSRIFPPPPSTGVPEFDQFAAKLIALTRNPKHAQEINPPDEGPSL
jgi:hypothetical protein